MEGAAWRRLLRPDALQWYLLIALVLVGAHYVVLLWAQRRVRRAEVGAEEAFRGSSAAAEGFTASGEAEDEGGAADQLDNDSLYDRFYARVYDSLVAGVERSKAETALTLAWARGTHPEPSALRVLDIGSGTGGGVAALVAAGVGRAVGLDRSEAMVAQARRAHPKLDFRVGEAETVGTFAAGEFNLVTAYYFTAYYLRDRPQVWRNAFLWMEPGGMLVVHAVNKRKFDPILEAASPFVAFSVQKYAGRQRVTQSRVAFDKFDYSANFALTGGDEAEFKEQFRFKDGRTRRQVHRLRMPDMDVLVREVEAAGFRYRRFIDLTPIGYEYNFLFAFSR